MPNLRPALAAAAFFLATALPAAAAPKELVVSKDWVAYEFQEGTGKTCFALSRPKNSEGNYTTRGETFVAVTHRPAEKTRDVVSVTAGYTYKADSQVQVQIGDTTFRLFTVEGDAWATDPADDKALIAAMKAGSNMVVRGTSSRGTATVDTYSLSGFTAAYNAASKACGG